MRDRARRRSRPSRETRSTQAGTAAPGTMSNPRLRVLHAQQLGPRPDHLRRGRSGDRRGNPARPVPPSARGHAAGAYRRAPGCASGRRRPDPGVRPLARRRPVRGPEGGGRLRGERHRDGVPAGAAAEGTRSKPLARALSQYTDLALRVCTKFRAAPRCAARPPRRASSSAGCGAWPAKPLAPHRLVGHPVVHRQPEHDDRPADRSHLGPEQPRPGVACSRSRSSAQRSRSACSASTFGARAGSRADGLRHGPGDDAVARDLRPGPPDTRPDHDPATPYVSLRASMALPPAADGP